MDRMNAEPRQALPEPLLLDDLRATGELVARGVDAFIAALQGAGPQPRLSDFVPSGSPTRRRLILTELVKVDLRHRWTRQHEAVRLESYFEQFPELRAGGMPVDLLLEEFRLRQAAGESVTLNDYVQRFPESALSLARLLDTAKQSTAPHVPISRDLPAFQVGDTLGEFRIQRLLGRGAFAQVYLAWQITLQRTVALKVARDRGTEPQTLAQLDHQHIVRVFDLRTIPEQELSLLSMKFVAGGTLEDVIDRIKNTPKAEWCGQTLLNAIDAAIKNNETEPPPDTDRRRQLRSMTWPQVVGWIGARAAAALDYAHRHGVLHRDIKPANILLTIDGEPQLADFNVSSSQLKEPGPTAIFGGTLPFMAPEQLEVLELSRSSSEIDARSDIYSLGMTLWNLLAGERPFANEEHTGDYFDTLAALVASRRGGPPAAAAAILPPSCPKTLVDVLRRCLAGEPADRFASADQLAQALDLCLHPETQALLLAEPRGPVRWVRRFPIAALLPLTLAPNIIASWLNILYNQAAVIDARPDAQSTFETLMIVINGVLFPAALLIYGRFAWPVSRTVRQLTNGMSVAPDRLADARRRCLRLGTVAPMVCVACWCLAGVMWPVSLDLLFGWLPPEAHLHFLISLALCGLIAAVYPFFLVTHLALRGLMPVLLRAGLPPPDEMAALDRLGRALGPNLLAAAVVPFVGIATLVVIDSHDRTTMKILVAFGLAGCAFAYVLERRIRRDLAAIGVLYRTNIESLNSV